MSPGLILPNIAQEVGTALGLEVLIERAESPRAIEEAHRLPSYGEPPFPHHLPPDRAVVITREVLVKQGYEVVRVETAGNDQVVWYRAGNPGRGRGKGPPVKMVI